MNWNTEISHLAEPIPFNIYPIPNNGKVLIDLNHTSGDFEFLVMNGLGKVLRKKTFTAQKDNIVKVDLNDLPVGILCVKDQ